MLALELDLAANVGCTTTDGPSAHYFISKALSFLLSEVEVIISSLRSYCKDER